VVNIALGLEPDDQIIASFCLGMSVGPGPIKPSTLEGVGDWI
jgi:hypothetical protein